MPAWGEQDGASAKSPLPAAAEPVLARGGEARQWTPRPSLPALAPGAGQAAAASTAPSRSPRPACWVALITGYMPEAHVPTLRGGEGTRGQGWRAPVGSKASWSPHHPPAIPRRGPSRPRVPPGEYPHPRDTLAPSCQVPILNCFSPLGLQGLGWGRKKRPKSS